MTHDYSLSCHESTGDGADTRHATTSSRWQRRSLSSALECLYGLEEAEAVRLVEFGAIYLKGARETNADTPVPPEAYLRVHLRPRRFAVPAELPVVASTDEFVVCCKPSGLPVHPTVDNLAENLLCAMGAQLRQPLLPTSRLDVETSGAVVLARCRR